MSGVHRLKLMSCFFNEVRAGRKTAEIRKSDRFFYVGDHIVFSEVSPEGEPRGNIELTCEITHVVCGGQFGIDEDYDMLSIKLIKDEKVNSGWAE